MALLATDSGRVQPTFCAQTRHLALEGALSKLCLHLLGQGGGVDVDVALPDQTARGMCDTCIQVCFVKLLSSSQEEWWST